MKKLMAVIISVIMLISVSSVSMVAFAAPVASPEETTKQSEIIVEVNGGTTTDVTYEKDPSDPNKITFTYDGDGNLSGWDFGDMVEGVDYIIISEDGNSITIQIINGYEGDITANAVTDDKEPTTKPGGNNGGTSPNTGAMTAAGLAVAGAGAAILVALKKKDAE